MVSDGDVGVALIFGHSVDSFDGGVRFAGTEALQDPFPWVFGMERVHMKVGVYHSRTHCVDTFTFFIFNITSPSSRNDKALMRLWLA